jgi:hypothetical protein
VFRKSQLITLKIKMLAEINENEKRRKSCGLESWYN